METKNNFSRSINIMKVALIAITFLIQVGILAYGMLRFSVASRYIYWIFFFIAICLVLKIIYNDNKASYKITWVVVLLIFPTTGILLYLLFGRTRFTKSLSNRIAQIENNNRDYYDQNEEVLNSIQDETFKSNAKLVFNQGQYPVYKNTHVEYLNIGEAYFKKLVEELKTAEKFIFMEYFIVSDGKMHRTIMDILKERANAGVEVRYMYDVAGSISVIPDTFKQECADNNIKLTPFNPLSSKFYNFISYRDHKKITVIDGYKGLLVELILVMNT